MYIYVYIYIQVGLQRRSLSHLNNPISICSRQQWPIGHIFARRAVYLIDMPIYSIKSLPSSSQNVALLHPNTLVNGPSERSSVDVITDIRRNSSHLGSHVTIYIWPVHRP